MGLTGLFAKAAFGVSEFFKKNRIAICKGVGYASILTSLGFAIKGTVDAVPIVEKEKIELKKDRLTPLETIKVVWPVYLPMIFTAGAGFAMCIATDVAMIRKATTFATLYQLSEEAFSMYKDEVKKTIGEKKELVVQDNVAKEVIKDRDISSQVVVVGSAGKVQCFDHYTKRPFVQDINTIRSAVNKLNHRMRSDMQVSLNDFYYEVGLDPVEFGNDIGWDIDHDLIEVAFSCVLDKNEIPTLVVSFATRPIPIS